MPLLVEEESYEQTRSLFHQSEMHVTISLPPVDNRVGQQQQQPRQQQKESMQALIITCELLSF